MLISTKGRYALVVMMEIASTDNDGPVSLKSIAEKKNYSIKYLETIAKRLINNNLLISKRGKNGGYILSKSPSEITVCDIVKAVEDSMAPVGCLESGCSETATCPTFPIWKNVATVVDDYLESVSLLDVLNKNV